MPIKGAVLKAGATPAFTGGTDTTFASTASQGSSVLTVDTAVTDARVRPSTLHTVRQPAMLAGGKFGKSKFSLTHRRPKLDADGTIVLPIMRVEFEGHPLLSAAEVQAFWDWLAQIATDADYANFRAYGSLD